MHTKIKQSSETENGKLSALVPIFIFADGDIHHGIQLELINVQFSLFHQTQSKTRSVEHLSFRDTSVMEGSTSAKENVKQMLLLLN